MRSNHLALVPYIVSPVEQVKPVAHARESYGFVSTRRILDIFEARGWEVESVQTNRVRTEGRQGFQKHLIMLKNPKLAKIPGLSISNDSFARLCLFNSHDMSSALKIFWGALRGACLNNNVFGAVFRHFHATHSKNVVSRLAEGIDYMNEGLPELIENLRTLQSIQMSQAQRMEYARRLVDMRLENVKNVVRVDYSCTENALRAEDTAQDAYTVMNRVQEYMIRGGVPYIYENKILNEKGDVIERRNVSTITRKLSSIPSQLRLSQALVSEIFKVTGTKPSLQTDTFAEAA